MLGETFVLTESLINEKSLSSGTHVHFNRNQKGVGKI